MRGDRPANGDYRQNHAHNTQLSNTDIVDSQEKIEGTRKK